MTDEQNSESKTHTQHPIPQNVLGVEFKLVGGLTLHQFGFLAVFLFIAWIIYASGLPGFIKTPIATGVALLGVFLGLVPIQDRSADIWLKNFLFAVSSPTERVWRKSAANLDVFFELGEARAVIRDQKNEGVTRDRRELSEYLRKAPQDALTPLDLAESEYLKSIRLIQNDVELPPGMTTEVNKIETETLENQEKVSREEIKIAPTLASEINYSQEKIISLPGLPGRQPKFVTPIQNVRTGRRFRLVKPGEVGLGVLGEKKIISPGETLQKQTQELAQKTQEVAQKIETAQKIIKVPPTPIATPAPTKEKNVINLSQLKSDPQPAVVSPPLTKTPPPTPTLAQPTPTQISENRFSGFESGPPRFDQVEAGKVAYLAEELKKIRAEKEALEGDLEKQKKARLEAETYASLAGEYQIRANEYAAQNSQLSEEIKKTQEQLKRLIEAGSQSASEKEYLAKQIKESERRVEQLAREKTQATDSLINMQKELRELRLKQRFTPTPPPSAATVGGAASGGNGQQSLASPKFARPKGVPFVKEANVISGYVRSKTDSLLQNAVIIVKDIDGSPVRALKTNELGQFAITTPVANGTYSVEVSGSGETFDIMTVEVFGSVLEPLDFVGT